MKGIATQKENHFTHAGADPGGSLTPPPEIYQGSQKNDVLV